MSFSAASSWVHRHVAAGRLPSAVLGVADARGILSLEAFGEVSGRATRTDDTYRLFSITKPLLGIAAARAIERGLLTPQTPLREALPDFGAARDDTVRLWHLASHTSGIAEPPLDTAVPLRHELLTRGRDFVAGSVSRYSTIAFEGIAALVEQATGQPWDAAVTDALSQTSATGITLDPENPVEVVDAAAAGLDMDRFVATRAPGAGLSGTAEDLLRLGSELLQVHAGETGRILAPATLAMMRRPLTTEAMARLEPYPAEAGNDWGFTWNLRTRAPGLIDRDTFGHGGWAGTEFWVHPTAGLAWVLLTNIAQRPGVDLDEIDNAVVSGL